MRGRGAGAGQGTAPPGCGRYVGQRPPTSLWADPHGGVATAQCSAFAHPDDAVAVCAAFLLPAAVLALSTVTAHVQWAAALTSVAIGFFGFFGFAIVPTVQSLVMETAGHAPTLASAAIQAAFNLANAAGAYLGWAGHRRGVRADLPEPRRRGPRRLRLRGRGRLLGSGPPPGDGLRRVDSGPHSRSSCRPAAHGGRADGLTGARALPGVGRDVSDEASQGTAAHARLPRIPVAVGQMNHGPGRRHRMPSRPWPAPSGRLQAAWLRKRAVTGSTQLGLTNASSNGGRRTPDATDRSRSQLGTGASEAGCGSAVFGASARMEGVATMARVARRTSAAAA